MAAVAAPALEAVTTNNSTEEENAVRCSARIRSKPTMAIVEFKSDNSIVRIDDITLKIPDKKHHRVDHVNPVPFNYTVKGKCVEDEVLIHFLSQNLFEIVEQEKYWLEQQEDQQETQPLNPPPDSNPVEPRVADKTNTKTKGTPANTQQNKQVFQVNNKKDSQVSGLGSLINSKKPSAADHTNVSIIKKRGRPKKMVDPLNTENTLYESEQQKNPPLVVNGPKQIKMSGLSLKHLVNKQRPLQNLVNQRTPMEVLTELLQGIVQPQSVQQETLSQLQRTGFVSTPTLGKPATTTTPTRQATVPHTTASITQPRVLHLSTTLTPPERPVSQQATADENPEVAERAPAFALNRKRRQAVGGQEEEIRAREVQQEIDTLELDSNTKGEVELVPHSGHYLSPHKLLDATLACRGDPNQLWRNIVRAAFGRQFIKTHSYGGTGNKTGLSEEQQEYLQSAADFAHQYFKKKGRVMTLRIPHLFNRLSGCEVKVMYRREHAGDPKPPPQRRGRKPKASGEKESSGAKRRAGGARPGPQEGAAPVPARTAVNRPSTSTGVGPSTSSATYQDLEEEDDYGIFMDEYRPPSPLPQQKLASLANPADPLELAGPCPPIIPQPEPIFSNHANIESTGAEFLDLSFSSSSQLPPTPSKENNVAEQSSKKFPQSTHISTGQASQAPDASKMSPEMKEQMIRAFMQSEQFDVAMQAFLFARPPSEIFSAE